MADKKYLVKQTVNYAGRGEKTATFTIPCGSQSEAEIIISQLDGKVEVYEMNVELGNPTGSTTSTSVNIVDSIKFKLKGAETVYVGAYNRPIVFKTTSNIMAIGETLKASIKPFENAVFANEKPSDVSIDTGNLSKL